MKDLPRDILQCIGNTSLLPLRNIVPKNGSRILLKLENENPTGSMKDRMALAVASPPFFGGKKDTHASPVQVRWPHHATQHISFSDRGPCRCA